MSGGVDSSVAASLLLEQGHEVTGVFMRHGAESPVHCDTGPLPIVSPAARRQGCCSSADAMDARRVAEMLDIPFYALNLEHEFARIIDYFVSQYSAGKTPNPCIACNNWIKFGKLFDYADGIGATHVATGHYARVATCAANGTQLRRGIDAGKDQSYVLFGVERRLLKRMLLPVGNFRKEWIRRRAGELGLRVADKPDSQEICFVQAGQHADFVASHRGQTSKTSGEIVTTDGRVVGSHEGIERFTVGQRKGLGIALGAPHFVVRIDADSRRVTIGSKEELQRHCLTAVQVNWLAQPRDAEFECLAQIRYNSVAVPAVARAADDRQLHVEFREPIAGVAPGQAVVCYKGDQVLCGGWIESTR